MIFKHSFEYLLFDFVILYFMLFYTFIVKLIYLESNLSGDKRNKLKD